MRIQLFPLHTVLAPGIALPLHVFEERYRRMVRRCLDESEPFGIVLIHRGRETVPHDPGDDRLTLAGMGTFAEIREADLLPDGRWNLLVVGSGRFRIRRVARGPAAAWEAEVEPVADEPGEAEAEARLVARVTRRFVQYLRLLQPRDGEDVEPIDVRVEVEVAEPDDVEVGGHPGGGEVDPDHEAAEGDDPMPLADGGDDGGDHGGDEYGGAGAEAGGVLELGGPAQLVEALKIPDDPSSLSFLLTGILQVEPSRKQALLEAVTAEQRMRGLDELLTREITLLRRRLGYYVPDRRETLASEN